MAFGLSVTVTRIRLANRVVCDENRYTPWVLCKYYVANESMSLNLRLAYCVTHTTNHISSLKQLTP